MRWSWPWCRHREISPELAEAKRRATEMEREANERARHAAELQRELERHRTANQFSTLLRQSYQAQQRRNPT